MIDAVQNCGSRFSFFLVCGLTFQVVGGGGGLRTTVTVYVFVDIIAISSIKDVCTHVYA